ncbi:MAG: 50S ribosomal protein L18e [Candidatus Altiarchaeota archaeon]|nr:50S ribosomal protein L18e [Candidatus Altiarchaeota archaeon]
MVRTVDYKDPSRLSLISYLRKQERINDAPIWGRLAEDLNKSKKERAEVNIEKINRFTKDKETVVVAGKILADGQLNHSVTLASYRISKSAVEKVLAAKGNVISIEELIKVNPKGTRVRILR